MKKFIAILMLFMYSLSVSGSVIQLHFCGNELQSFSVNAAKKQKSCCCPVDASKVQKDNTNTIKKKSCCSQTEINLSIDVDQRINASVLQLLDLQIALPVEFNHSNFGLIGSTPFHVSNFAANAPPKGLWQNIPLYKLFQSLVYYA